MAPLLRIIGALAFVIGGIIALNEKNAVAALIALGGVLTVGVGEVVDRLDKLAELLRRPPPARPSTADTPPPSPAPSGTPPTSADTPAATAPPAAAPGQVKNSSTDIVVGVVATVLFVVAMVAVATMSR